MLMQRLAPSPPTTTLSPEQQQWLHQISARLKSFNPSQLFDVHVYLQDRGEIAAIVQGIEEFAVNGGYNPREMYLDLISQLLFTAMVTKRDPEIPRKFAQDGLGLSLEQIAEIEKNLKQYLPKQVNVTGESPQTIKDAGFAMGEAWQAFKINVGFVDAIESGLRHYAIRFHKPVAVSFDKLESTLPEVLSAGGFDPDSKAIFSRLPNNSFEVHIPKPPNQARAMSFLEYLALTIRYQPKPGMNQRQALRDLVLKIVQHYHPLAAFDRIPMIPVGIDTYGKPFSLSFDAGGLIIGGSKMGKSTFYKMVDVMHMLMFPPQFYKPVRIDFKSVTMERFTLDWQNPWALCEVLTSQDVAKMKSLVEGLNEEHNDRNRIIRADRVESWLDYNRIHPKEPIPYTPILWDEVGNTKAEWIATEVDKLTHLIASKWRYAGMPLVAGTQYPSDQHGISPTVRTNLDAVVAFSAIPACAALAFSTAHHVRAVTKLLPGGNFIARTPGSNKPVHAQAFDAPPDVVDEVLEILKEEFGSESFWLELREEQPDGDSKQQEEGEDETDDAWDEQRCPKCDSKAGKHDQRSGRQRYRCRNPKCRNTFTVAA